MSTGPSALVRELANTAPDWPFRHAACRGGWHRLGGLIDAKGKRLTDNLESWAETELATRQGDLGWLAEDYAEQGLLATRLVGRTHYLVAQAGDGPADFLQLEIEELQEIASHTLFADGEPATLDELLDPQLPAHSGRPLGLPYYVFRRVSHAGAFVARMRAKHPEPGPIHRMLEDWAACSAGQASDFCNHWVLGGMMAVVVAGLVAAQTGQPLVVATSDILWCLLMGLFTMSGGMILYTLGSKVVPSAELTLLSNTEVMLAPFWVWLIMGETASAGTFVGGAILMVAILFNAWSGARRTVAA